MTSKFSLTLDPSSNLAPTRDHPVALVSSLPPFKETKTHPTAPSAAFSEGSSTASLYFIGTATTVLEWEGLRLLTDPNFLHAGDHVHLGPGVTGTRVTNPAIDLHELPRVDAVLLSHYHADHFDQKVEASLRRDLPIITTPHARDHLTSKPTDGFTVVHALDHFESGFLNVVNPKANPNRKPCIKVTAMPGKHVPPGPAGVLAKGNELLGAVPPTNGWMLELGYAKESSGDMDCGYRIYISGDTLMVDELKEIPERYKGKGIDLMLIHLGGTTIPGPKMPLLMVTMDAEQGVNLIHLIDPALTIPIHYDDYDVFLSPLSDFQKKVTETGLDKKVVYLDRGDGFKFDVKADPEPVRSGR